MQAQANPRADGSEVPYRPPGHSRQGPHPSTQVPQKWACSCPGGLLLELPKEGLRTPEQLGLHLPRVLEETYLCKLSSVLSYTFTLQSHEGKREMGKTVALPVKI